MLSFGEKCLASPQFLLGLFTLGDVAQVAGEGGWPVQQDASDRDLDGISCPSARTAVISTCLPSNRDSPVAR